MSFVDTAENEGNVTSLSFKGFRFSNGTLFCYTTTLSNASRLRRSTELSRKGLEGGAKVLYTVGLSWLWMSNAPASITWELQVHSLVTGRQLNEKLRIFPLADSAI
jgi:hypothetical protein